MNSKTQQEYWSTRWKENDTPWDMGSVSPPLAGYFQGLTNKAQRILIPGAGSGHEFVWLWENGFRNVYVLEIAAEPLQALRKRLPEAADHLIHADFFEHNAHYDLIVEQTFFCALPPEWRGKYAQHIHQLLKPGGKLMGLLFDFPLTEKGPPFGGSSAEYLHYFTPYFSIETFAPCYNSIKPRAGKELFFSFVKAQYF